MRLRRFRIRTLMIAVAAVAVEMWLATWSVWHGIVYAVVALGLVMPITLDSDGGYRLRCDARQVWLCYLGGVVAPIVCLILDPFVFRDFYDDPFSSPFTARRRLGAFCYPFMFLSMVVLTVWLRLRNAPNPWAGLISGALWAAAVFAFGLGIMLFPFSLIGLVVLIGALGFTPFATAYVFQIQARRAAEHATLWAEPRRVMTLQIVGAALLLVPSVLVVIVVWRSSP